MVVMNDPQGMSRFMMSGTQSSFSGLVVQGAEGSISPKSPGSPTSPLRTMFLSSPTSPHGAVSLEGFKIIGPNPAGAYVLVNDKKKPSEGEDRDQGPSAGTLPSDVVLEKKAAPPQGVLGSAAQKTDYSHVLGHFVAINRNNISQNWYLGQINGSLVMFRSSTSPLQLKCVVTVQLILHTYELTRRLSIYVSIQLNLYRFKSLTNSEHSGKVYSSKCSIQNLSSFRKYHFKHKYCENICKGIYELSFIYNNIGNTSVVNVWDYVGEISLKIMKAKCVVYVITIFMYVFTNGFYVIRLSLAWTQKSFTICHLGKCFKNLFLFYQKFSLCLNRTIQKSIKTKTTGLHFCPFFFLFAMSFMAEDRSVVRVVFRVMFN